MECQPPPQRAWNAQEWALAGPRVPVLSSGARGYSWVLQCSWVQPVPGPPEPPLAFPDLGARSNANSFRNSLRLSGHEFSHVTWISEISITLNCPELTRQLSHIYNSHK